MNPLFVGIDVSSKNNVVCLMKPDGTKFSTFSVQKTLAVLKYSQRRSYRHWTSSNLAK